MEHLAPLALNMIYVACVGLIVRLLLVAAAREGPPKSPRLLTAGGSVPVAVSVEVRAVAAETRETL
jgi:hypothetical protein